MGLLNLYQIHALSEALIIFIHVKKKDIVDYEWSLKYKSAKKCKKNFIIMT